MNDLAVSLIAMIVIVLAISSMFVAAICLFILLHELSKNPKKLASLRNKRSVLNLPTFMNLDPIRWYSYLFRFKNEPPRIARIKKIFTTAIVIAIIAGVTGFYLLWTAG